MILRQPTALFAIDSSDKVVYGRGLFYFGCKLKGDTDWDDSLRNLGRLKYRETVHTPSTS